METVFPAACLLWVSVRSVGKFLPIHQTFYHNLCPQTYCTVHEVVTITIGDGTNQSLTRLPIWVYWVRFRQAFAINLLPKTSSPAPGSNQRRILSPEAMRPGRESDQSTQACGQVTKALSFASVFMIFTATT